MMNSMAIRRAGTGAHRNLAETRHAADQAGGGIVYDSDPVKEWEETMNKGRALFRAVAQAASGL